MSQAVPDSYAKTQAQKGMLPIPATGADYLAVDFASHLQNGLPDPLWQHIESLGLAAVREDSPVTRGNEDAFGTFVDISLRDISSNMLLHMCPFRRSSIFAFIDISNFLTEYLDALVKILDNICSSVSGAFGNASQA
ncbi:uncharacterized protein BCR38DRAFT_484613 [Pseudomassariella vexata]|uniref:Uncharacterized protein n=1 Tax=Pseudomassariella vexata TaxID=1141098 RepID=A0A1Y2E0Z1_9PEZI|nr:uncharacterized protein BCR38DRAFT_484613 [Pseudomassariella vexata]ORY65149.1 hypothetical protein BCR38DRAFT_484613 [Pseudomassariella vexata]